MRHKTILASIFSYKSEAFFSLSWLVVHVDDVNLDRMFRRWREMTKKRTRSLKVKRKNKLISLILSQKKVEEGKRLDDNKLRKNVITDKEPKAINFFNFLILTKNYVFEYLKKFKIFLLKFYDSFNIFIKFLIFIHLSLNTAEWKIRINSSDDYHRFLFTCSSFSFRHMHPFWAFNSFLTLFL